MSGKPASTQPYLPTSPRTVVERPATQARADFFQLLDEVVTDPDTMVLIQHRHLPRRAVLLSEQFLEYVKQLERVIADLMATRSSASRFTLCGSGELHGDLEAAIAEMRQGGNSDMESRFRDL